MTQPSTTRRSFLMRDLMGGAGVTVGLPILDCFLNGSGTAYAATLGGGRLPAASARGSGAAE